MNLSAALLAAALPVALLPPDARELPAEATRAAVESMTRALPAPFAPAPLDALLVRTHLDAAGPACRHDGVCLCSAVPLTPGALALDLTLAKNEHGLWSVDLSLLSPCEGKVLARRAELIEANKEALSQWIAKATEALLKGRDLGPLRRGAK